MKNYFGPFVYFNTFSQEIKFEASNMEVKDNGNILFGYETETFIPLDDIEVKSNKVKYIKNENILIFTDEVIFEDKKNNIVIQSPQITYEKDKDLIYSIGKTKFYILYKKRYNYT